MPSCYQFDNAPVKAFVAGSVQDFRAWEGYRTVMVTRIGQRRRAHIYLKEHMDAVGLSDERLANRLGVARETVFRWRTEQHRLNPEKLAQIASALNREPEELYRPPDQPSLDAMVKGASPEVRDMVVDIVKRLVNQG